MASLKVKVSFTSYMFDNRFLVKLGILYGEELALSSWWSILAEKLDFFIIMDLVSDMAIYVKREMRPNTLVMPPPYCIFNELFCLS